MAWSHNDFIIENQEGRYEVDLTQKDQTYVTQLTVHDVTPEDAGSYRVVAANDFGELNMSVSLIVKGKSSRLKPIGTKICSVLICNTYLLSLNSYVLSLEMGDFT